MKEPFIGARLADITLFSFVRHGIPVPVYALNGELLLLFRDNQDCQKYVSLLEAIGSEMSTAGPTGSKSHIREALTFIAELVGVLNCN